MPYIKTHEAMSEEEVFELAEAAANASMIERRNQQTRFVHRQLHNTTLRTSGLGTSSSLPRNLSPHNLSSRSLDPPNFLRPPTSSRHPPARILPPPTAIGPPGLPRMQVQPSTSSHPARAFQSMASAPPPPPPSFNSTGRMYLDSRLPQQAPTYRSPYGPLSQMDGSSDEPDDEEKRALKGPVWAQWSLNGKGKIQIPANNANARSTNTSSERPLSTGRHNDQASSGHTETVASPAIDQQQPSENAPAPAPTPSPATSGHPAGPNRPALHTGRTPLPSQPHTARSAPLLAFGPSSDDERAAREEEEYRRQREGVPRISPTHGAGSNMQAPTQGPSSAPAPSPVRRTPLPSSRPPVRNGGLNPNTLAQTRSDPLPNNPSDVETGSLASPSTPRSTAALGSPGTLPQNPPAPDGLQLPASEPSYRASIARGIPTSSREGPNHSPYSNGPAPVTAQQAAATAITSSGTAPAASAAVPGAANVPAMDMTFPKAHYVLSPAAQVPFGNPAPPFQPQIQFQVRQPRQRRGSSLADTYEELHAWRAKIRDFRGLPSLGDRSQPSITSAPTRPRPQNDQSGSGRVRGRKRPSGDSYIQEITKQEVKRMIAELKEEYNAMARKFQPLPSIFNLAEDNFLPPPNPSAIHPDFERESTAETTARRQWLNYRHNRLEAGRHAYVQGGQGTPNMLFTFDHDGEETAQAPLGTLHDRPRNTPAGGMRDFSQLNFQGPAVPQPPFANSFDPNPYGSRSSIANPFGPNPHNPQPFPPPGNGRGGMASSIGRGGTIASNFNTPTNPNLAPPPMRFFNQGFGTQNGPPNNTQPQTAPPKPKSETPKSKKTKIKTEPKDEVNPFTD